MVEEVMIILTAKSADTILAVGGTQSWTLDRAHAKRCRYAILCQNAHTDWGDGKEAHGKAFMVGRVNGVVPSTETKGRYLITFSHYAMVDKPSAWEGWRNPIRYVPLSEVVIDIENLKFKPMPPILRAAEGDITDDLRPQNMTIAEAKEALAKTFGVPPDAIEITIRG